MPSRMRRLYYLYYMSVTTVLAALAGSACSDPDAPEPIVPCSGKVAMSVALNDTTPRFDWTPRCGVTAPRCELGSICPAAIFLVAD